MVIEERGEKTEERGMRERQTERVVTRRTGIWKIAVIFGKERAD